ncbi:FIST C-terminal domain-containing protein [Dechloromonas hortensis]|uniref:FIST C-terminal domain-containing protein n=1 Tax=Dechloromonas hortensis TaxID=337779 RepID=UPI0014789499|nr:FIST C-terminal domain-containing protein [Dechloromonas hortensis]
MKAGSGLASGPHPAPELASQAVRQALAAAGLERAAAVILFLSREFSRQAQPAILAAARTAGCLQVFGGTASGLFTECGWLLDQPGAAALVLENAEPVLPAAPIVSFSGHTTLPFAWQVGPARLGLLDTDAAVWAHGRLAADGCAEVRLPGQTRLAVSPGLRRLGEAQRIDATRGYDICRCAGQTALASLQRNLPAELRDSIPLHQIVALRRPDLPGIPILSANADGSLSLAEALSEGETITWAIRQPLAAEQDMRQALSAATIEITAGPATIETTAGPRVDVQKEGIFQPDCGLMFSCIGRGPLFYGDDDRDLLAFRQQFPDTPLLGAYGSGQIAPAGAQNRLFHNSVITLLIEGKHV